VNRIVPVIAKPMPFEPNRRQLEVRDGHAAGIAAPIEFGSDTQARRAVDVPVLPLVNTSVNTWWCMFRSLAMPGVVTATSVPRELPQLTPAVLGLLRTRFSEVLEGSSQAGLACGRCVHHGQRP